VGVACGVGIGVGAGVGIGAGVAVGGGKTRSSGLIPSSRTAIHIHAPTISPIENMATKETSLIKLPSRNFEGFTYRGL